MSTALTLHPVNGEPRIRDLELAERLGFADQYMIRKLIKRNEDKLLKFGVVSTVETTSGALGGRPATEFYLNQKQAVFLCMKSETDNAFEVQQEIVRVFDAWLNGTLDPRPALVPSIPEALLAQAQAIVDQYRRLDAHDATLAAHQHRIGILENTVVTMMSRSRQRHVEALNTAQRILDFEDAGRQRSEYQGGHHASPKPHQRRAHYRQLADGRRVEVRASFINSGARKGETLQ